MNFIRHTVQKLSTNTLLRYFLSYFLLFGVLILGFAFIIRSQFTSLYYEQLASRSQEHLNNIAEGLTDEIISLNSVTLSMESNMNVILSRYVNNDYYEYLAYRELCNYNAGRPFIDSIVYLNKNRNVCTSSSTYTNITWQDGAFYLLTMDSDFTFDLEGYFSTSQNQLLFLCDEQAEYLIYLPVYSIYDNHLFFYIINKNEISQLCRSISSSEMPAVALIDSENHIIAGTNTDLLLPYMESFDYEAGIYSSHKNISLCISPKIIGGYRMVSLISGNLLLNQVDHAFQHIYLIVLLLCGIGLFLILLSMQSTYLPLKTLTQKLVASPSPTQGYLEQLDQVFSETAEQNQKLAEKLDSYRLSMQKSILDSIISANQPENMKLQPDIDQFFTMEPDNYIFAVRMQSPGSSEFPCKEIVALFRQVLPEKPSCVVLEILGNTAVFLLNYPGTEPHKDEVVKLLMTQLYQDRGYLSAVSNSSLSPMDIPSLYEHALQASSLWPHMPAVLYQEAEASISAKGTLSYPYDTMNSLSVSLKDGNFTEAIGYMKELFQIIDRPDDTEDMLPTFFIRCILIDMLSAFINAMNHSEIKFKTYFLHCRII